MEEGVWEKEKGGDKGPREVGKKKEKKKKKTSSLTLNPSNASGLGALVSSPALLVTKTQSPGCWQMTQRSSSSTARRRSAHLPQDSAWPHRAMATNSRSSAHTAQHSSVVAIAAAARLRASLACAEGRGQKNARARRRGRRKKRDREREVEIDRAVRTLESFDEK